jgi:hypothetical protein
MYKWFIEQIYDRWKWMKFMSLNRAWKTIYVTIFLKKFLCYFRKEFRGKKTCLRRIWFRYCFLFSSFSSDRRTHVSCIYRSVDERKVYLKGWRKQRIYLNEDDKMKIIRKVFKSWLIHLNKYISMYSSFLQTFEFVLVLLKTKFFKTNSFWKNYHWNFDFSSTIIFNMERISSSTRE